MRRAAKPTRRPPAVRGERRPPEPPARSLPARDDASRPQAAHAEHPDPEPTPPRTWDDRAG